MLKALSACNQLLVHILLKGVADTALSAHIDGKLCAYAANN